tara:strand:- start:843 stop:1613 length:771 start_codon:yes stop_codon:yes gene_type:complete
MRSRILYELELYFNAQVFYTRFPGPDWVRYDDQRLSLSSRYLPFIGLLVGMIAFVIYSVSSLIFSKEISILLCMASTIMMTGAFHEDGLADSYDGLYGGFTRDRILEIMKDSRIGTYGSIALFMTLIIKFQALIFIENMFVALLIGNSLSRFAAICYIPLIPYARQENDSKAKPAVSRVDLTSISLAAIPGLLPLLLIPLSEAAGVLSTIFVLWVVFKRIFVKKVDGITGDLLGASQQIFEIGIYLILGSTIWIYT